MFVSHVLSMYVPTTHQYTSLHQLPSLSCPPCFLCHPYITLIYYKYAIRTQLLYAHYGQLCSDIYSRCKNNVSKIVLPFHCSTTFTVASFPRFWRNAFLPFSRFRSRPQLRNSRCVRKEVAAGNFGGKNDGSFAYC